LGVFHGTTFATPAAEPLHFREATQDVNNRTLREQPGLHPGTNLLFNGWGGTPAGRHGSVPDLALKLVIAPDHRRLVAVHGGFTEHGVSLIDITKGEQSQFLALKKSWNGLAFSRDGKRFFVSGSDSGEVHVFNYAAGQASFDRSIKPAPDETEVFLAGIAVRPDSGRIYICNEASHEVCGLNPKTLPLKTRIRIGLHPHSCLLGADHRPLSVSDWGSRSITVAD